MRRLLALLVLLGLGAVALYYWKYKPASAERAAEGAAEGARDALHAMGEKLRETKITGAVKAAFELNRELAPHPIDIDADEAGVVTLKGQVPSEEVKALAGRVAAAVPDVTQVVNQLTVGTGAPPAAGPATGAERARRAEQALAANPSLAPFGLKVREEGGGLVLTGRVKTAAEKDLAGLLARDAAGAPVQNNLRIGP